jgi:hypothetical protein
MAFRFPTDVLGVLTALAVLAGASTVHAQPESNAERAEEAIREGVALRRSGHETEALEKFARAYELVPSARARAQMGLAEKSLRRYIEAEQYLREALREPSDPWTAENQAILEQALDFVDRQLAWVTIVTQAPEVDVTANGRPFGRVARGAKLRIFAGDMQVDLSAKGFGSRSVVTAIPAQTTTNIEVQLPPAPRETPHEVVPPPAPRAAASAPPPSAHTIGIYASAVVAVAGLAAGTYFGVRAADTKSERDAICPMPSCPDPRGLELDSEGRSAARWSTVTFGVAAMALVTGVVLFVTRPADKRAAVTASGAAIHF